MFSGIRYQWHVSKDMNGLTSHIFSEIVSKGEGTKQQKIFGVFLVVSNILDAVVFLRRIFYAANIVQTICNKV